MVVLENFVPVEVGSRPEKTEAPPRVDPMDVVSGEIPDFEQIHLAAAQRQVAQSRLFSEKISYLYSPFFKNSAFFWGLI